jgi:hypothetical protein
MRGEEEDEKDGVCVSLFMIQCGIGPSKSVCRPGMCSEDWLLSFCHFLCAW